MRQALVGQRDSHHQVVAVPDRPRPHPQPLESPQHGVVLRLHQADHSIGTEQPRFRDHLAQQPQPESEALHQTIHGTYFAKVKSTVPPPVVSSVVCFAAALSFGCHTFTV